MNNSNKPAMPLNTGPGFFKGLNKREYAAIHMNHEVDYVKFNGLEAMAEFIGRKVDWESTIDVVKATTEAEAKIRVMRADALLAELEKNNG